MKRTALAMGFSVIVTGGSPVLAQTYGSIDAYGSKFELTPFEKMEASVAVASDRNGRKFNVVKAPNGKMMVLLPVEKVKNFSPYADDSEMMFGGTKGSTR
ncbi:hypothetical protein ACFQE0_23315 [Methylobacterium komagatae]|jgi:hypothetical protein|uniref:Uncharacterized protein n=2 Tax=Methylobacterium komagatae TaxID=374425 RepID=A0ABW2BRP6_9HYPH